MRRQRLPRQEQHDRMADMEHLSGAANAEASGSLQDWLGSSGIIPTSTCRSVARVGWGKVPHGRGDRARPIAS